MSQAFKSRRKSLAQSSTGAPKKHIPTRGEIVRALTELDYRQQYEGRPGILTTTRKNGNLKKQHGLFHKKRYGRRGRDGTLISNLDLRQRRNALLHRLHETAE